MDDPEDEDEVMALPEREEDVKQFFLDQVFDTQLIWASSTLQEVSYFDKGYERDPWLKYFLQRFPDTYLVFYQPSFKLKNATLDAEVIMLTPTEVMCVSILDRDYQDAVFYPSDDRKWTVMKDEQEKSIVNPVIKLKRMEKLVQSIFDYYEVDFPIKKYLLAQQNQIVHQSLPFQTEYIDQTNYPEWFHKQRESKYPIKAQQLKACEKMLEHTLRHYVNVLFGWMMNVELVLRSHDMYVLIINPVAGRGKGIKIVKEYLKGVQNPQNYKSYYTEYPGHATKLVAQVVSLHEEKIEMLVVVGGDGTFYEVINGVKAYGDLPLAFVPVGSGNDFARGCSMPLDPKESLRTIFKQKRFNHTGLVLI
ncbi:acylglycerol kinase family protein [Piscibacillus salipiscarius]|uniref:acylglycerol kinase family protein n=1 Tax=Piscibacillus salipiscarius TaxID=299480 RepID=UPI0024372167|nr:acylglycerol kinase family protein [Piscibacillus salipiscarius]